MSNLSHRSLLSFAASSSCERRTCSISGSVKIRAGSSATIRCVRISGDNRGVRFVISREVVGLVFLVEG